MVLGKRRVLYEYLRTGFLSEFKFFFMLTLHYLSQEHLVFIQNFFWKFYFIKFFRLKKTFLSKILSAACYPKLPLSGDLFLGFVGRTPEGSIDYIPRVVFGVTPRFLKFLEVFFEYILDNQHVIFYFLKICNIVYDYKRFKLCFPTYHFEARKFLLQIHGVLFSLISLLRSFLLKFYFLQLSKATKAGIA